MAEALHGFTNSYDLCLSNTCCICHVLQILEACCPATDTRLGHRYWLSKLHKEQQSESEEGVNSTAAGRQTAEAILCYHCSRVEKPEFVETLILCNYISICPHLHLSMLLQ
jgi:hypothetical protein